MLTAKPSKSFCRVNGYDMAYVEMVDGEGTGDVMVFLHGNPTSSYLWRNIMAPLQGADRRLLALDLVGMGDSDKLEDSSDEAYSFANHTEFLDKFMEECIGIDEEHEPIVLVLHDWGSALGFWWAYRHQDLVKGFAYMESLVQPLSYKHWDNMTTEFFQQARTPGVGEVMMLEQNIFVEQMIPFSILRNLTEEEMAVYREPYLTPGESRRPTLTWPREVPIDGTPADNAEIISTYSEWMSENQVPKLLISAEPGILLTGESLELARSWPNQFEVTVQGLHYIQEDSPSEIADAIEEWLASDMFIGTTEIPSESDPPSGSPRGAPEASGTAYLVWIGAAALFRLFW